MTPERLMHIHLGECSLHAGVLAEALIEARKWLPFNADTVQRIQFANTTQTQSAIVTKNKWT